MAEGYLLEECLTFCSRYMDDIETNSISKIEYMMMILWVHPIAYLYSRQEVDHLGRRILVYLLQRNGQKFTLSVEQL